jgi:parallel beta-helix repeat protein
MVKFTSSGATSSSTLGVVGSLDWVSVLNSTSNTNATGISALALRMSNISVVMTGTSYAVGAIFNGQVVYNIRVEGNASASSGVRQGIQLGGTTVYKAAIRACVFNHVGGGIADTSVNAGTTFLVAESVAANCGASGILGTSTASQTTNCIIRNCMITGNGAYGINPQSSNDVISQNRLRNNTSGNFNTFGNFPSTDVCDVSNIYGSQAAADAAEYVDTTTGDFRIKSGSPIWGYGYGVSDQPSSGSVANVSFAFLG